MTEKDEIIREIQLASDEYEKDYRILCKTAGNLRKAKERAIAKGEDSALWDICKDIADNKCDVQYYLGLVIGMTEAIDIIRAYVRKEGSIK